jgi:hypothetical protein
MNALPNISDIIASVTRQAKLIESRGGVSVPERLKQEFAQAWGKPTKVKTDLIELTTSNAGGSNNSIDLVDSKLVMCAFAVSLYEGYTHYLKYAEQIKVQSLLNNEEWKLLGEDKSLSPELTAKIKSAIDGLSDLNEDAKRDLERFMTAPKEERVADLGSYKGISRTDAFQPAAAKALGLRVDHYGYINDVIQVLQRHEKITRDLISLVTEADLSTVFDVKGVKALLEALSHCLESCSLCAANEELLKYVASLAAKPFLVLTGLSGSGKTKLAQAFVRWLTPDSGVAAQTEGEYTNPQYALIPVGADWTGNENILGYPDGLDTSRYVSKTALDIILHAVDHPELPHFLILDEMNLSHVERYFADMLSAIESGEPIHLYGGADRTKDGTVKVPQTVKLPGNLFIIGTVNVDETTYMFSPKVLDRANVIEFKMDPVELESFLKSPSKPDLKKLDGAGAEFGRSFVNAAKTAAEVPAEVAKQFQEEMLLLFRVLQLAGAEFGYRVAHEAARFLYFYKEFGGCSGDDTSWFDDAMDAVIVQKVLPKLHGSRGKLEGLLWALATVCGSARSADISVFFEVCREAFSCENEAKYSPPAIHQSLISVEPKRKARYASSFDKIMRMYRKLVRDQFVTFAEA